MKITNKSIARANKIIATVTKRLPVNVTVTKKPSKMQTALCIISGLALYGIGVGIMLKANEPTYIQMPTFTFTIPEIKPIVDEENN